MPVSLQATWFHRAIGCRRAAAFHCGWRRQIPGCSPMFDLVDGFAGRVPADIQAAAGEHAVHEFDQQPQAVRRSTCLPSETWVNPNSG